MRFEVINKRVGHFGWIYLVSDLRRSIKYKYGIQIPIPTNRVNELINRHNNLLDGDVLICIIRDELYAADAAEETLDVLLSSYLPLLEFAGTTCEVCDS